jgi:hypothetical protein
MLTRNPDPESSGRCPSFLLYETMTIGITGPERDVPRQSAVVGFIIASVVVGICLIMALRHCAQIRFHMLVVSLSALHQIP